MGEVWFVDTSVLLNILDVPRMNADRDDVGRKYAERHARGAVFVVPVVALIETGNHIAQLPGGHERKTFAERFVGVLRRALAGEIPSATPVSLWTLDEQLAAHA